MRKTLVGLLAAISLTLPSVQAESKDKCVSYYTGLQSHNDFISNKLQLEKTLVNYAARTKTDAVTFLSLSIVQDHNKKYDIGGVLDPKTCDISNVFIHTSHWSKTNNGEFEWVPQSTVREFSKGDTPFYSPYKAALKEISEVLEMKNKKFEKNDIPLAFLLAKYGKKNYTDSGETIYVWSPSHPKSVVQFGPFRGPFVVGFDTDNDGILNSLRFDTDISKDASFVVYEDHTADGISAGDKQYTNDTEQTVGAPIAYNFFASTQRLRSITQSFQKRMKK